MTAEFQPLTHTNPYFQRIQNLYNYYREFISNPNIPEYPISHLINTFDEISKLRDWFLVNNPNPEDCLAITQIIAQLSQPNSRRSRIIVESVSSSFNLTIVKGFFEKSLDKLDPVIIPKVFHFTYN